jgi:hypothetical protein
MIYLLLVCFAAVLNAFMDTVENENFHKSRFKDLDQKFWYKRVSWMFSISILGYKLDAWHIAKSLMIISLALAFYFYKAQSNHSLLTLLINVAVVWNVTFVVFYYKVFRK